MHEIDFKLLKTYLNYYANTKMIFVDRGPFV